MNNLGNNHITNMKSDDALLENAVSKAVSRINNDYYGKIPDNWTIDLGSAKISFKNIREEMLKMGYSAAKANAYYGGPSSIITDGPIVYITIRKDGKKIMKPIFLGEMKKQGTNDKRLAEGKSRQAIGNAGTDRVAKNFMIASDYCYLHDRTFFPYNVFLHGCDFSTTDITTRTLAKLKPFFGKLNKLNPYFDKEVIKKGGSCFYQDKDYTEEQLENYCYKCCELGIKHYMDKYKE